MKPSKFWTPEQYKKFRSDVTKLRRKGLIPKASKISPRKITPWNSPGLVKAVARFEDVLSGQAHVATVPKAFAPAYREQGYRGRGRKIVLQKSEHVVTRGKNKGQVVSTHTSEGAPKRVKERILPYQLKNLDDDIIRLMEREAAGEIVLGEGDYIGFKVFGWNSKQFFKTIEEMYEYLMLNYGKLLEGDPSQVETNIHQITIMKIEDAGTSDWGSYNMKRSKKIRRRYGQEMAKVRKARGEEKPRTMSEFAKEMRRLQQKEWNREHYDTKKNTEKKRRARAKAKAEGKGKKDPMTAYRELMKKL